MRVFVPVEDGSVDAEIGALVPYRCGVACAHELRGVLVLRDGVWQAPVAVNDGRLAVSDGSRSDRPTSRPASSPRPR